MLSIPEIQPTGILVSTPSGSASSNLGTAAVPFSAHLKQASLAIDHSGETDADRTFYIDSNLPQDLKQKLTSMWEGCKNEDERQHFMSMYNLTFRPTPLTPPGYWNADWRKTLNLQIKANEGLMGSASPLCRANMQATDELLKKLLA